MNSGGYVFDERLTPCPPDHVHGCPGLVGGDHEINPDYLVPDEWEEDEEGYLVTRLSYEDREGQPEFNGAFDRW